MNSTDKYYWITSHPKFMHDCSEEVQIDITPHNVCPTTERIEDYKPLNTKTQYWVELMIPYFDEQFNRWGHLHDHECDCGGWTYEEAIDNLYELVLEKYGDYTEDDYNKRFYEIHDDSSYSGWLSSAYKANKNANPPLESRAISEHELVLSKYDTDGFVKYKLALTTFYPTATVQQQKEIDAILKKVEHDEWVHNQELKWRLYLE